MEVLRQLFTMSEEELGLPGDGHITLPFDAFFMEYIISLIHLEKGLLTSVQQNHFDNINKKSDNTSVTLAVLANETQISINDQQQDSFKDGKEVAELNCHQEEENLIAKTH
ncbi:hypothetical protein RJ639_011920 [Escallonia herrerae]|uniref:Uncharacterized protein n=1 Tax=Escallonia herrerae TaxID=1293975 RepID=A0AA88VL73_9ASTE|nr:hypothetical protein RJ639_011920 [Escallonia herrerae]